MNFESIYRVSLYLLLIGATVLLNLDADVNYARYYPVAMIVATLAAYFTVDRDPSRGLPSGLANVLGLLSILLVYIEVKNDDSQLVLACGHWLFYLTIVKLFRPKSPSDDWYLILLALMQVLVGCFLSQSDRVGMTLLAWAILALWVLSLFYLHRESQRFDATSTATVTPLKARDPYPGLIAPPFIVATCRAAFLTLLCGVLIFLVMPRSNTRTPGPRGQAAARALTGFSDEIRLGQMGEILENDAVVMSVELYDSNDARVQPVEELRWRGVVLNRYFNGKWSRSSFGDEYLPIDQLPGTGPTLRQHIRLESTSEPVIFALRPFIRVQVRPQSLIGMNPLDGTLLRNPEAARRGGRSLFNSNGPIEYTVTSLTDQPGITTPGLSIQPGEGDLSLWGMVSLLTEVPDEILPTTTEISNRVIADIPENNVIDRARALESYLRDSDQYGYDLTMARVDPTVDPIVDFLENRKRGHCEYFASALAMLLRSQKIPCRIVNGLKGGDWNDLARVVTVRQKHAHSWVEAYMGSDRGQPIWLTLDPTPAAEREEEVARVGNLPGSVRQFSDFIRYVWVFYVAGFNADRQEQLLYGPIRQLFREATKGFLLMGDLLRRVIRWMTDFPSFTSFFSVKGFVLSITVMILLAILIRLGRWIWPWLARRLGRGTTLNPDLASVLAAYSRLVHVLAQYGLERPISETPREFARRASLHLGDRSDSGVNLAEIPSQVVDAFYRVRYGGLKLNDELLSSLDSRVDALEAALRPTSV